MFKQYLSQSLLPNSCGKNQIKKDEFLLEISDEDTKKEPQTNNQHDCCSNLCHCWVHQSKTSIQLFSWSPCYQFGCLSFMQCNVHRYSFWRNIRLLRKKYLHREISWLGIKNFQISKKTSTSKTRTKLVKMQLS